MPYIAFASLTNGTIDPAHHYAWSKDFGWLNFAATQGNIHVTDSGLAGYVWNANTGWMNLAPTNSGQQVVNDGEGHLSGSAWAESVGWFGFSGITIDVNGLFHGIAAGSDGKTFTFDCDQCSVRTDWRPVSVRAGSATPVPTPPPSSSGGGGGGGGGSFISPTQTPTPSSAPTPTPSFVPAPELPNAGSVQSVPVAVFPRPLSIGMRGADVAALQTILEQKGFLVIPPGIAKGYFGVLTREAVAKYQTSVGITVNGVFGPSTRAKLILALGNNPSLPNTGLLGQQVLAIGVDLRIGSRSSDVKILQQFLIAQHTGPMAQALAGHGVTMNFGTLTQAVLAEFQANAGISPALGYFGPITRAYLRTHY